MAVVLLAQPFAPWLRGGDLSQPAISHIERVEKGLVPAAIIKGRPAIKMELAERMRHYNVPGVSVAVINDYKIEWAKGYGVVEIGTEKPVTTETLFQAGSISKPITALAVLRIAEDKKISLNENINQNLTSWKVPDNEFTKDQKVTLGKILSHSPGLNNPGVGEYTCDEKLPSLLEALDGIAPSKNPPTRVAFIPGSRWLYSGGGYAILQQFLIDLTKRPFPEIIDEVVFKKLGMDHSTFEQKATPELLPLLAVGHQANGERLKCRFNYPEMAAAGLWTTPSDLARFVIEIQKSELGQSNRVLSTEMTHQMLTARISNAGLGVFLEGNGKAQRFSHGGGNQGFFSYMIGYPKTGQGAVVMINGTDFWDLLHEIIRGIAVEYRWPDYVIEHDLVKVSPKVYGELAGRYEVTPEFVLTVSKENGKLVLGEKKSELLPESPTKFFLMDGREVFFLRNQDGTVKGLVMKQNDLLIEAKRVR